MQTGQGSRGAPGDAKTERHPGKAEQTQEAQCKTRKGDPKSEVLPDRDVDQTQLDGRGVAPDKEPAPTGSKKLR